MKIYAWRYVSVDLSSINDAERTIEAVLSSEQPYLRAAGYEVLEHSKNAIDTRYLDAGAAFLEDHDLSKRRGGIVGYAVDEANRQLRTKIKFSERPEAEYLWRDIKAGITPQLSVGYFIDPNAIEVVSVDKDSVPTYVVRKWTPYEGSSVVVAADPVQAGIGRSVMNAPAIAVDESNTRALEDALNGALERYVRQVEAAEQDKPASEAPATEEAEKPAAVAADEETKHDDVAPATEVEAPAESLAEVEPSTEQRSAHAPAIHAPNLNLTFNKRGNMKYNLQNAVRALHKPQDCHETEVSRAIASQAPQEFQREGAIWVPFAALRSQTVGDADSGGNVIDKYTNMLAASAPERAYNFIDDLGITYVNAPGRFTLATVDGARQFHWGTGGTRASRENAALLKQSYETAPVEFSPVRAGSYVEWSDQLQMEGSFLVPLMQQDLNTCIQLEKARVFLNGNGTNEPAGLNERSVSIVDFAAAIPTRAELLTMEQKVRQANGIPGVWLTSNSMYYALKNVPVGDAGKFLIDDDGLLMNRRVVISDEVPAGEIWLGDWTTAIWADFGGIRIELVRDRQGALEGMNQYVVSFFSDTNVRRAAKICKGKLIP
jgi:HK97 family phage major capsid protein